MSSQGTVPAGCVATSLQRHPDLDLEVKAIEFGKENEKCYTIKFTTNIYIYIYINNMYIYTN